MFNVCIVSASSTTLKVVRKNCVPGNDRNTTMPKTKVVRPAKRNVGFVGAFGSDLSQQNNGIKCFIMVDNDCMFPENIMDID